MVKSRSRVLVLLEVKAVPKISQRANGTLCLIKPDIRREAHKDLFIGPNIVTALIPQVWDD